MKTRGMGFTLRTGRDTINEHQPTPVPGDLRALVHAVAGGCLFDVRSTETTRLRLRDFDTEPPVGVMEEEVARKRPHVCPVCYLRFVKKDHAAWCCDPSMPVPPSLIAGAGEGEMSRLSLREEEVEAIRLLCRMGYGKSSSGRMLGRSYCGVSGTYAAERKKIMREYGLETSLEFMLWRSRVAKPDCPDYTRLRQVQVSCDMAEYAFNRGMDREEFRTKVLKWSPTSHHKEHTGLLWYDHLVAKQEEK